MPLSRVEIEERVSECCRGAIVLEPRDILDKAIIGISDDDRIIYSADKLIRQFTKEFRYRDEAICYFEENVLLSLSYMGSRRPIILLDY